MDRHNWKRISEVQIKIFIVVLLKRCFLGIRHREQVARKERLEFMSLSYTKGTWIIIFGVLCVFLNLLILFKMIM